jgi:Glycosyltransferase family 87
MYWMVSAWLPRPYALVAGLLALGITGNLNWWFDNYFCIALACLGATLVLGSLPRIAEKRTWQSTFALGTGLVLLMFTRPYEDFWIAFPCVVVLIWNLRRAGARTLASLAAVPVALLATTSIWLLYYNWRGTGHAFLFPYMWATSVLCDLPLRTSSFAGSDMKTLFASVWCFAHGLNAYTIGNVQSVFVAHDVVFPGSWFGHAPVYPPTTLALLLPLTALPMVPAVYGVVVVSAVLFAIAATALLLNAAKNACPLLDESAIAAACACCPLFSFALSMGNVSVAASALCILSFVRRKHGTGWLYGALLAVAVLLKPHLAIWMLTGMLLLPERAARAVAARAAVIAGGFAIPGDGGIVHRATTAS